MHRSFSQRRKQLLTSKTSPALNVGNLGTGNGTVKKKVRRAVVGGNTQQTKPQINRSPPKNKKFHGAYHKDIPGWACSTWSCTAMKYIPFEEKDETTEREWRL